MPRTMHTRVPDPRPGHTGEQILIVTEYHDEVFLSSSGFSAQVEVLHTHTNLSKSALLLHRAYLCPQCGDIWLRRIITPHAHYSRGPVLWTCLLLECEQHGGGLFLLQDEHSTSLPLLSHDATLLLRRHYAHTPPFSHQNP